LLNSLFLIDPVNQEIQLGGLIKGSTFPNEWPHQSLVFENPTGLLDASVALTG
jgi:hypothetical protein